MSKTDGTSFGDRMKQYEQATTAHRSVGTQPVVVRIDGNAFHTLTRKYEKPFDVRVSTAMHSTMRECMQKFHPSVGYCQSDEITFVWHIPTGSQKQMLYDGRFHKFESLVAAYASVVFNRVMLEFDAEYNGTAIFDARAFNVPNLMEAANCLMWRQTDCRRNAISAAAHAKFGKSLTFKKNSLELTDMLKEVGINVDDYPMFFTDGVFAYRARTMRPLTDEEKSQIPEGQFVPELVERGTIELFYDDLRTSLAQEADKTGFLDEFFSTRVI